jgi:hypothetical protein
VRVVSDLTVGEDEFHRLLTERDVEIEPPLSDEALGKMKHNRETAYNYPDMEFLDEEPAVDRLQTYARAALNANSRIRKLARGGIAADDPELNEQQDVVRHAAVSMFVLLRPLLEYHTYWTDVEDASLSAWPDGHGLQKLEVYTEDPGNLDARAAFAAVQAMRECAIDFGLIYDDREELLEAAESVDYWKSELGI